MKILFIGRNISGYGGMETVITGVISALNNIGYKSSIMLFGQVRNDEWLKGIDVIYVNSFLPIFLRDNYYQKQLEKHLFQNEYDILICFDAKSCMLVANSLKNIVKNIPVVSWMHFSLEHKKKTVYIKKANYHLAISTGIKQQMVKIGIPSDRIFTIFNPIKHELDTFNIRKNDVNDKATFLYLGRIVFEGQKYLRDLIDAVSVLDDFHLHIVGDGEDRQRVHRYIEYYKLTSKITIHGWQLNPWQYIQENIHTVDALCLTSVFEGFPMVLVEAASRGIPIISSNCPTGPNDIVNVDNGFLYPVHDIYRLRDILRLFIYKQTSFSADKIKQSMNTFYLENYLNRITNALNIITGRNHYNSLIKRINTRKYKQLNYANNNTCTQLNICYGFDSKFVVGAGVSIQSFAENNKHLSIEYHLFTENNIESDLYGFIELAENLNLNISIYVISIEELELLQTTEQWNYAIYFRIIGINYLVDKGINNILYVDSDTVCVSKLDKLLTIDLKDNIVGVVNENIEERLRVANHFHNELFKKEYFNSGVIYVNTELWMKHNTTQKVLHVLYNFKSLLMPDQDALNLVLSGNIMLIDDTLNVLCNINNELKRYTSNNIPEDAIIIHYVGITKPWYEWAKHYGNTYYFIKNQQMSPWKDISIKVDYNSKIVQRKYKHEMKQKKYISTFISFIEFIYLKIKDQYIKIIK